MLQHSKIEITLKEQNAPLTSVFKEKKAKNLIDVFIVGIHKS